MVVGLVVEGVVVITALQIAKDIQVNIIPVGIVQHVNIIVQAVLDNVVVAVLAHVEVVLIL